MRLFLVYFLFFVTLNNVWASDSELAGFLAPSDDNRVWAFWVWQNGNITKEGITRDLEAMKQVGIGGALIMELGYGNIPPRGQVDFLSDDWRKLFGFMLSESERLGLEINMFASAAFGGGGGAWIKPEHSMLKIVWSENFDLKNKLKRPPSNLGFYKDIAVLAFPTPSNMDQRKAVKFISLSNLQIDKSNPVIAKSKIIDVTDKMQPDGTLNWSPSADVNYIVLRIGYTSAGTKLLPPPVSCKDALECDKLSTEAAEIFFNGQTQRLIDENKKHAGKTFVGTHIDSWEVGSQNWTPKMREEFQAISKYDILYYLPVFAGYQIDSPDATQRFLWDFRNTVSQLVIKNYAWTLRRLANKNGLAFSIEAYDKPPCDFLQYGGAADLPTGEFWTQKGNSNLQNSMRGMASAAHIYGNNIVPSEAFTAFPNDRWTTHPATFKPIGDLAFCEGTNRMIFHAVTHQPYGENIAPGLMYYKWGSHYERTQTWWNQTVEWHDYLKRCQFLLRKGKPVADIAYLEPEIVPQNFTNHPRNQYLWDHVNFHVIKTATVNQDKQIVLQCGMKYNVLVMPNTDCFTLPLIQTIEKLAEAGATIIVTKIPKRTPYLANYIDDEKQIEKIITKLIDGKKVIIGEMPENVLMKKNIEPDFTSTPKLNWTRRKTAKGTDIYFVANTTNNHVNAIATFRSTNFPELWNPINGKRIAAPSYIKRNGKTTLFLPLKPCESMFVVFPQTPSVAPIKNPLIGIESDGQVLFSFTKSKELRLEILKATYGPANMPDKIIDVTETVRQLTAIDDAGVNVADITASCGDPALNIVKQLTIQFKLDNIAKTASAKDGNFIPLANNNVTNNANNNAKNSIRKIQLPVIELDFNRTEIETLQFRQKGDYVLRTADGNIVTKNIDPVIIPLDTEWTLTFPNQKQLSLQKLVSWTESDDDFVKYFSGTAAYSKIVNIDPKIYRTVDNNTKRVVLDLGEVYEIAETFIDGKQAGTLWYGEKRLDITNFVTKNKSFKLEIRVTNLLQNRLIGDQFIPEIDVERKNGIIQKFPQWYIDGKQIPGKRSTFSSWELYNKQDKLLPSGITGPVFIEISN